MKKLRIFPLLLLGVLLSGCGSLTGGESIPPTPLVDFTPSLAIRSLWTNQVGGTYGHYLKLMPDVRNGVITAASYPGLVTAVDARTGRTLWRVDTHNHLIGGVGGGSQRLYVGTDDGDVLALSRRDGSFVWRGKMASEVLSPPVEGQGVVVAKAENGDIVAFEATHGRQLWDYPSQVPSLILRGSSTPQIVGNRVVIGLANGQVISLSLHDGRSLWTQQVAMPHGQTVVERMVDIDADPHVVDGIVYVATYQGRIAALDLNSGRVLWRQRLSSYSGLAVGSTKVYVSDADGNVWALNRDTGTVVWRQNALLRRQLSGPVLYRGAVVVGGIEGYLHWLSQSNGRLIARTRVDSSAITASPFVQYGRLYALSSGGTLEALA